MIFLSHIDIFICSKNILRHGGNRFMTTLLVKIWKAYMEGVKNMGKSFESFHTEPASYSKLLPTNQLPPYKYPLIKENILKDKAVNAYPLKSAAKTHTRVLKKQQHDYNILYLNHFMNRPLSKPKPNLH